MPSQYRSILRAISIFGGTQLIQVVVQLVRTKFVAIFVGTEGMGLSSMYMSSLLMIITIFGMGINSSVVRDLSKANDDRDEEKFAVISAVFKRMILFLSISGMLFVMLSAPLFSEWSFGSQDYSLDYVFLSSIVLFTLLNQGNSAILTGKRRIKEVALCSLYGSIANLLISVPVFYIWRLDGIVPGMILSTISSYVISLYFIHQLRQPRVKVSLQDVQSYGSSIFYLGVSMIVSVLAGNITNYIINIVITRIGDIHDLGLFNAGMGLTTSTVTLVFAAMAADYYPRLVASLKKKSLMNDTINQQSEILIYVSAPILCIFSFLSPIIISILLTEEFSVLNGFVKILCVGMLFKSMSYALGYLSFAKGDIKVYMLLEAVYGNLSNLLFSILFYYLWGLKGIAIAFLINYLLYYIIIRTVDKFRYRYLCSSELNNVVFVNVVLTILLFACNFIQYQPLYVLMSMTIIGIICFYNLRRLDEKTQILSTIKENICKK